MVAEPQVSLAARIRSGESQELRMLAAQGLLPLPLEELITLQVYLAEAGEPEISPVATSTLRQLDPQQAASVIAEAEPEVVSFLALHHPHPSVVEQVLLRRDVPRDLLCELAPQLDDALQEILLLRQDAIVERPAILDALAENPKLSAFSMRRISEYRQHLLPSRRRPRRPAPAAAVDEPVTEGVAPASELEEAAVGGAELSSEAVESLVASDGFSEVEIRTLPTPLRMQLSRGAPRNLRALLIRDSNVAVALSVLTNNAIPESELEQIAGNRSVLEEVIEEIARNPRWVRKYRILKALVGNPRTPVGLAVRLASQLAVRDLRTLSRDRNVSDAVRATCKRLYRIKLK